MTTTKEAIWANAFNASLVDHPITAAANIADEALLLYERRWPADRRTVPIDELHQAVALEKYLAVKSVLDWAHAASRTQHDLQQRFGREDAAQVLVSFADAMQGWLVRSEDGLRYDASTTPPSWSAPAMTGLAGGTLDQPMLQRAIVQLEADGRWDALAVLRHLVAALVDAQEHGRKLIEWGPPPRGKFA